MSRPSLEQFAELLSIYKVRHKVLPVTRRVIIFEKDKLPIVMRLEGRTPFGSYSMTNILETAKAIVYEDWDYWTSRGWSKIWGVKQKHPVKPLTVTMSY